MLMVDSARWFECAVTSTLPTTSITVVDGSVRAPSAPMKARTSRSTLVLAVLSMALATTVNDTPVSEALAWSSIDLAVTFRLPAAMCAPSATDASVAPSTWDSALGSSTVTPTPPPPPLVTDVASLLGDDADTVTSVVGSSTDPVDPMLASTRAAEPIVAVEYGLAPAPRMPTVRNSDVAVAWLVPVACTVSLSAPSTSPSMRATVAPFTLEVEDDKAIEMSAPEVPSVCASAQFFTASASTSTAPVTLTWPVEPMPASMTAALVTLASA